MSDLPKVSGEDDEPAQVNERRKKRNSKMKHRSQTHRERRKKDVATEDLKADSGFSKEEQEKCSEGNAQNLKRGSSAGSTSSGVKHTQQNSLPFLPSPVSSPHQKNNMNLPPLATSRVASYNKDVTFTNQIWSTGLPPLENSGSLVKESNQNFFTVDDYAT